MNFNSLLIGSEDPQRLVDYYSKLFGEPTMAEGGYTGWQVGTGWVTIGPHDQVNGKNPQPGRLIWNIETADVRGEFERFVAAGATVVREPYGPDGSDGPAAGIAPGGSGARRARPVRPRGIEGRRLVADEYRAAQEQGADPVLAVMRTTGHSRRRSLSMIAQARDAGFLTPRHARR